MDEWSDLQKDIWERRAQPERWMYLDRTDPAGAEAFNVYGRDIMAAAESANHDLIGQLLSLPSAILPNRYQAIVRRWRNEVDLFNPDNLEIGSEIGQLEAEHNEIAWSVGRASAGGEPDWRSRQERLAEHRSAVNSLFLRLLSLRRRLAANVGIANYREYAWRDLNRLDYTSGRELLPIVGLWRCSARCNAKRT